MPDIYKKLRKAIHERTGMGLPASESGIELKMLAHVFEEKEAMVAADLTLGLESPKVIADRLGEDEKDVAKLLESMYRKGLIRKHKENGSVTFSGLSFAPGMVENLAKTRWESDTKLRDMLIELLNSGIMAGSLSDKVDLLRTVPVESAVPGDSKVASFENAAEMIKKGPRPIVILPCRCRDMHRQLGAGCEAPLELCYAFGDHAQFYIDNGTVGKEVDLDEALRLLKVAAGHKLVHTFLNYMDNELMYLCNCCKCCCWVLSTSNQMFPEGRLKGIAPSSYIAIVDDEKCLGCEACVDSCQTLALKMADDVAAVTPERCVGCGLCVSDCPEEAIQLFKREEDKSSEMPQTYAELTEIAHKERFPND